MAASLVKKEENAASGPRPIQLSRDSSQIVALLESVFGPNLNAEGERIRENGLGMNLSNLFTMQLNQWMTGVAPGFVWEEDGRIVGNASLLKAKQRYRYLVANVAVHPQYRRQGIGRELMKTVINYIREQGGRQVWLQVEHENEKAINLYRQLGFQAVGNVTTWDLSMRRVRELPLPAEQRAAGIIIRPLRRTEWRAAFALDQASFNPALNWPDPLAEDSYKGGFWRWLDNFLNGRRWETWVTADKNNRLTGMATIRSEWGLPHEVSIRVRPERQGQLERSLLAHILTRLRALSRQEVRLDHPADDAVLNQLLPQANFRLRRTLTTMRLDLTKKR